MRRRSTRESTPRPGSPVSAFRPDVITLAVRWHLRYGSSYPDGEELRSKRGIALDHALKGSVKVSLGAAGTP